MDAVTYALSKRIAASALSGVASMTVEDTTLKIVTNDGTNLNMVFPKPKDGVSIVDVDFNDRCEMICKMSDGSVITTEAIGLNAENISYENPDDTTVNNIKTALDKLFSEGGGILEEPITSNISIGTIKPNQVFPKGTPLEEIVRQMLTEKVAPTVTMTLNPSTVLYDEVNDSISSLTINAVVTKKTNGISKVVFYVNDVIVHTTTTGVANGGTVPYIHNSTINDDTTIKVVVVDTESLTATATKSIEFIANSYYGLIDANIGEPTESLVKTLTKKLKNVKKLVYEGITTDWSKVCYAYPAELGKLTSIIDKVNNFNYTSSFQLTTIDVDGINYYVYTLIDPTGADNVTLTFE